MLTVAGFASSVEDWQKFSIAWTKLLKDDGIEYFHATDLDGFWGPFKHLHDNPNRKGIRKKLCADLMDILKGHVYRKFACTIINKAFQETTQQLQEEFALCAYSLAGRSCEKKARQWLVEEWTWPENQANCELVFEEGDKGKGKLQKRLANDSHVTPIFKPKKKTALEDGSIREAFVPLQAADWFAYELNVATQRYYEKRNLTSESELRWPMQEFLRYPPGYMGIYTPENLQEMQSGLDLQKRIIEWEVATGLDRLRQERGRLST